MFSTERSDAGHRRRQAISPIRFTGDTGVPTGSLSVRRIKKVLRPRFELGLGQRETARACAISQGGRSERWLSRRLSADSDDEER